MGTQRDPQSVAATVLEEHKRIVALVDDLEKASDPARLMKDLDGLREVLEPHFTREETQAFVQVRDERPEYASQLDRLVAAHSAMLELVESMRGTLAEINERFARVEHDKTDFLVRLRAHEAAERKLFADVYMQDLGAKD